MQIIGADGKSSIKPGQVDATKHLYDAFDNNETEVSAHYIVLLCQERRGWFPFTLEEIESVYTRRGPGDGFTFNHLVSRGWIGQKDNTYYITQDFIDRVFRSSPTNWWKRLLRTIQGVVNHIRKSLPAQ